MLPGLICIFISVNEVVVIIGVICLVNFHTINSEGFSGQITILVVSKGIGTVDGDNADQQAGCCVIAVSGFFHSAICQSQDMVHNLTLLVIGILISVLGLVGIGAGSTDLDAVLVEIVNDSFAAVHIVVSLAGA